MLFVFSVVKKASCSEFRNSRLCTAGRWVCILCLVALFVTVGNVTGLFAGAIPLGGNTVVTDAGLNGELVDTMSVVVRGNERYVVWGDGRDDDIFGSFRAIYFARSSDGGQSWGANVRVSDPDYDSWAEHPQIAVAADGTIWIVWYLFYQPNSNQTNEIRLARSVDGGATFTLQTVVDGFPGAEDRWRPQLAIDEDSGNLLLLYTEYDEIGNRAGFDIFLRVYTPQLQLLKTLTVNDQPLSGKIGEGSLDNSVPRTSLVARNGLVCAAWEDSRQRFTVHGACSSDGGQSFGANFAIGVADSLVPQLALGPGDQLSVTYYLDADSKSDVYLRISADRGATWSAPVNVTQLDSFNVRSWDYAVDENGQHVVAWIYDDAGSSDLWLSTSLDQGQNWARTLMEDNTGQFPTVSDQFDVARAVDGSGDNTVAQVIWSDDRNVDDMLMSQAVLLDSVPPTAPGDLTAVGGDGSILLTWQPSTDTTGIQGYRVYRSTTAGGPYTEITPLLVTATSYRDVELDTTPYFYRVAAVDGTANTGPLAAEVTATARAGESLPLTGVIAYEVGNDVRLRDAGNLGTERVLGEGNRPRFSADGTRIYAQVENQIVSRAVTGGDSRPIYTANGLYGDYDVANFDPVNLANNERHIAAIIGRSFVSTVASGICFVSEPYYTVNGQQRFIDEFNYSEEIALSADARWLLYRYTGFCNVIGFGLTSPGALFAVNLTTNEVKELPVVDVRDPDFAPDPGDPRVVMAAPFTGQYEIWVAELDDTGQLRNYVQLTRGAPGILSRSPAWSADGNWIIFQRDTDPGAAEANRLFIVRADGSSLRDLGVVGERPAWAGSGPAGSVEEMTERVYLPEVIGD